MPIEIRLVRDQDAPSPRENDNLGKMVCWHGRYTLGDEQPRERPEEYEKSIPEGSIVLPLYLYDHSGITMRTTPFHCQWDSGQVGWIYASPEALREEYGAQWNAPETRATATKVLEAEVSEYDLYLTGDAWGFEKLVDGEVEDACYGFLGGDPFTNGMSEHFSEEEYPALAKAAEEAGQTHSWQPSSPKPKKPKR